MQQFWRNANCCWKNKNLMTPNKRNLKDDQHSEYLNMDKMLREHCPNECCQVERHSWNHKHPNWEASPQGWISNISSINKIHRHYDHCIAFPHLENFNSVWYFNVLNQRQNNPSVHCGLKLTCCKREKSNCDFGKVFFLASLISAWNH